MEIQIVLLTKSTLVMKSNSNKMNEILSILITIDNTSSNRNGKICHFQAGNILH